MSTDRIQQAIDATRAAVDELGPLDTSFVPLPDNLYIDPDIYAGACPWLDQYIDFSRRWSPWGYEMFHEATGLWVLSTVAARRVRYEFGGPNVTQLSIVFACRTSAFAKTTTAKIGAEFVSAAGLDHMLAPSDVTPEALISMMGGRIPIPGDYDDLLPSERAELQSKIAFAGQRGWFHEEFGSVVNAVAKGNHYMSSYRELLRRIDDGAATYSRVTQTRGTETVRRPYLSLLGNTTPGDLVGIGVRGGKLWNDGFFARLAFIAPRQEETRGNERFPRERKILPPQMIKQLAEWHKRLGIPTVSISRDTDDSPYRAKVSNPLVWRDPPMALTDDVYDAVYDYVNALTAIANADPNLADLAGNYIRSHEKALRIAALLASFDESKEITMKYWGRAREIAERWRQGLHNMYDTVSSNLEQSESGTHERVIAERLRRYGVMTARELSQKLSGRLSSDQIKSVLGGMVDADMVTEMKEGRKTVYVLNQDIDSTESSES